jgi:Phosphotransferase enzyme family
LKNMEKLLPPDAALLRREAELPGLGVLLDPDAFRDRLGCSLGRTDFGSARVTYVKYVPGQKCLVGYQLNVGDTQVGVHATAYPPAARRELDKPRNRIGVPGALGPGRLVVQDLALTIAIFPNDRRLPALPYLADAAARKSLLGELVPARPDLWDGTPQCLGYKPQRRYVARLDGGGTPAVLKMYAAEGYRAALANATAFTSRGCLRLANLLGSSDREGVLVLEWLPGRPLCEALADAGLPPAALTRVGAALAELHAQEPRTLPGPARDTESAALGRVADALGLLHADLAGRVRALARRLAAALAAGAGPERATHGDFNPSQVLLAALYVSFLDLDRAARGDPALDLGNFLAYLERDGLRGLITPMQRETLAHSLVASYRAGDDVSLPARVKCQTAAGLFRCLNPFRYWEPHRTPRSFPQWEAHWPERIEAYLDRIEVVLAQRD